MLLSRKHPKMIDSNTPKLKMCGLWREEDILCANTLKPDYIGFVFAPSSRQVLPEQAKHLKSLLLPTIQAVGVFVDMDLREIIALAESNTIDIIQLHDSHIDEGNDREIFTKREDKIRLLQSHTNTPIIKAIAATSTRALLAQERSCASMLLLDNAQGGSGERFAWEHIEEARMQGFTREFFLAGGLNASNLATALQLNPYGIDLSKGLESNGLKDCHKMREICRIIQSTCNPPTIHQPTPRI